jgi:hypothetical protein
MARSKIRSHVLYFLAYIIDLLKTMVGWWENIKNKIVVKMAKSGVI